MMLRSDPTEEVTPRTSTPTSARPLRARLQRLLTSLSPGTLRHSFEARLHTTTSFQRFFSKNTYPPHCTPSSQTSRSISATSEVTLAGSPQKVDSSSVSSQTLDLKSASQDHQTDGLQRARLLEGGRNGEVQSGTRVMADRSEGGGTLAPTSSGFSTDLKSETDTKESNTSWSGGILPSPIPGIAVLGASPKNLHQHHHHHHDLEDAPHPSTDLIGPRTSTPAPPGKRGAPRLELTPVPPSPLVMARKSPVTVQEWVDSLPHTPTPDSPHVRCPEELETEEADTLVLGAEAGHLCRGCPAIVVEGPKVHAVDEVLAAAAPLSPHFIPRSNSPLLVDAVPTLTKGGGSLGGQAEGRRENFIRTKEQMASFASDSAASNASSAGVESFLESRKLDPENILLNLGFGGSQDSNGDLGISRIPQRFLQPSSVKGIRINDFYRHQFELAETFETGFYGYRGLTGPSHHPSPIVAKIMEKLRRHDRDASHGGDSQAGSVASAPAGTVHSDANSPQQRFSDAVQKIQQSRSVLTRIQSWKSIKQQPVTSVLNPDNRKFLETQALSKSPEVPRKLIMGRAYTVSGDGNLVECKHDQRNFGTASMPDLAPRTSAVTNRPSLTHKDSLLSSNTSFSGESEDSDDELLLRRRMIPLINNHAADNSESSVSAVAEDSLPPSPLSLNPSGNPVKSSFVNTGRHSSFHKRMSSTSLSSWESDTWLPSPPGGSTRTGVASYNTFSSIDEAAEGEVSSQMSAERLDQDMLMMKDIPEHHRDSPSVSCYENASLYLPPTKSPPTELVVSPVSDKTVIANSDSINTSKSMYSAESDLSNCDSNNHGVGKQCQNSTQSQTSSHASVSSDASPFDSRPGSSSTKRLSPVPGSASARRGSLKRQSRVSSQDEDCLKDNSDASPSSCPAVDRMEREEDSPPSMALMRTGSAQSDSSGFQDGEEGARQAAASTSQLRSGDPSNSTESVAEASMEAAAVEARASEECANTKPPLPSLRVQRLEELEAEMARLARVLEAFRAECMGDGNRVRPEAKAQIHLSVEQMSGVIRHLQSLRGDLEQEDPHPGQSTAKDSNSSSS